VPTITFVSAGQTMPGDTCRSTLVSRHNRLDNGLVHKQGPTWRLDLAVAWFVGLGVFGSGVYDWLNGQAPSTVLPIAAAAGFVVFAAAVWLVIGLGTLAALALVDPWWRYVALGAALLAVVVADPTYASLLMAVPLIDVRRRVDEPLRRLLTVVTLATVAFVVLTEQTRRVVAEVEAMFVLAIAMAIVVMFGDSLRRMDRARAAELNLARVDERNRLARELHDSLGHNLLACSIQLRNATAQQHRDPEATTRAIDLAGRAVAEALADTRLSVDNIRADSDGFSLEQALPDLVERAAPTSMTVDVDLRGDYQTLDQLTQITLYRVAQEALTNIVRHANAGAAAIRATVTGSSAVLEIRDDGDGFDLASAAGSASGLQSIRERMSRIGGRLDVETEKGAGTTLTAVVGLA
jgi:signal transduction histidine kinase